MGNVYITSCNVYVCTEPPDLTGSLILRKGCTVEHVVSYRAKIPIFVVYSLFS